MSVFANIVLSFLSSSKCVIVHICMLLQCQDCERASHAGHDAKQSTTCANAAGWCHVPDFQETEGWEFLAACKSNVASMHIATVQQLSRWPACIIGLSVIHICFKQERAKGYTTAVGLWILKQNLTGSCIVSWHVMAGIACNCALDYSGVHQPCHLTQGCLAPLSNWRQDCSFACSRLCLFWSWKLIELAGICLQAEEAV